MDLQEFINNTNGINIAMAAVISLALLGTVISHFKNRGRNSRRSIRDKRARRQF